MSFETVTRETLEHSQLLEKSCKNEIQETQNELAPLR